MQLINVNNYGNKHFTKLGFQQNYFLCDTKLISKAVYQATGSLYSCKLFIKRQRSYISLCVA